MLEHKNHTGVRRIIMDFIKPDLERLGLQAEQVNDDTDLMAEGIIDSFGFLDLVSAVEESTGLSLDLGGLDLDSMSKLGGLVVGFLNDPNPK